MDNTKSLSESILQSSDTFDSSSSLGSSDYSIFDTLKDISVTTWILIILLLAFLGFNIFIYLAKGTQGIADFFAPFLKSVFGITLDTTSQVVDVSAEGAKAAVAGTAGATQGALTAVQDITPNNTSSSVKGQSLTPQQQDVMQQSSLNKALNSGEKQKQTEREYEADTASSSIQGIGKSGWCYIGEDRGYRTCAQVGANDQCMSGDIFPTHEICMNPNLRT